MKTDMTKFEQMMANLADRLNLHRHPPWKINLVAAIAGMILTLGVMTLLGRL